MTVVVGIMAKAPVAGRVKTRLTPPLSAQQAAAVARDLLADTVETARASGFAVTCVHAGAPAVLRALLADEVRLLVQRGAGLADRLAAAQADLHAAGHDRVLLIGADCPTLDAAYVRDAAGLLDSADVVLGPACDGGYTLIGSRAPEPGLFEVTMSTPWVLRDTQARARALGRSTVLLDPRHDLDVPGDFSAALNAGQLDHVPRARRWARILTGGVGPPAGSGDGLCPDGHAEGRGPAS